DIVPLLVDDARAVVLAGHADRKGLVLRGRDLSRQLEIGADIGLRRAVEIGVARIRPGVLERSQIFYGEDLSGKQHMPETMPIIVLEVAVLDQQTEHGGRRVPDADGALGDRRGKPRWCLAELLVEEDDARAVLQGHIEIEDRQIEMEGGV